MAKVEDCPGFETFGADVKAAREAKRLARKTLAEMVGIEWRYLANIENQGAIPVSYTHLDVYKRQLHELMAVLDTCTEAQRRRFLLDVYKRQP